MRHTTLRRLLHIFVSAVLLFSGPASALAAPAPAALLPAAIPGVDLRSVAFLDASTGFAAGASGVILKTEDGGDNWSLVRSGSEDLRAVGFWTASEGVAVSYNRKVLGTTDGGLTWSVFNPDFILEYQVGDPIGVNRVVLPPGPTGYEGFAVGGYDPSGGVTYVPEQVWKTSGNRGYFWGSQPVLRPCRYPDPLDFGGDPVGRGEFFGGDFVDASRGWVVGVDYFPSTPTATVYATGNGGVSWVQQSVGAPVSLRDVSFATTTTGVAVSAQGRVFYTNNGGTTWIEGSSPVTTALHAVEMLDASKGWAVGAGGRILRTVNGGVSWTLVSSPTGNDLYDLAAVGTRAWAVGRYGTIVLTTDGVTWRNPQQDLTPPVIASLASPSHPDAQTWYANADPSFTWSATDPSGVAGFSYVLDAAAATVPDTIVDTTATAAAFVGRSSGEWWFHLRAVDRYGNWSAASHLRVRIDTTPPVTTDDAASLYSGPATITLTPSDAHSGVALTRWVLDGAPGTGTVVTASADGTHTLAYASIDNAGNAEATKTVQFVIDRVLPAVIDLASSTHPSPSIWYRPLDASFTWTGSSNVGVDGYSYELSAAADCVPDQVVDVYAGSAAVLLPGEGVWYFCVRAKDVLGRWGATQRRAVRIDRTPPVTTDDAAAVYTSLPAVVTLAPSDARSGVALTRWTLNGAPGTGTVVSAVRPARYKLSYWSVDNAGNVETAKERSFDVVASSATSVAVAGNDRYLTAVEASKRAYPVRGSASAVVVATGENWPDALGGAALAGAAGGPLLLTRKDELPVAVGAEIARLKGSRTSFKVYVVGGTGAVGDAVFGALQASYDVTRIAGPNRYETARAIADEVIRLQGSSYDGRAFFATGRNFPDALGASPAAAAKRWPVYLVDPASTAVAVNPKVRSAVILGGIGVVSDAYEQALVARFGREHVVRVGGSNRYDTAAKVSARAVSEWGLYWDGVAITNGKNFPDALSGGALQGRSSSVMLLTDPATLSPETSAALANNRDWIAEVRFLGGYSAVSAAARSTAMSLLK